MLVWGHSWHAYAAPQQHLGKFGRGVAKGVATVLLFSCFPQAADPVGKRYGKTSEVFADTAREESGFRVGVVGEKGFYCSLRCPNYTKSLQKAKLFAGYVVAKMATYREFQHVKIGSDRNVARFQCAAPVGSTSQ